MSKPTTAECIKALDKAIEDYSESDGSYSFMAEALIGTRAQLLAAQEMAKALETCKSEQCYATQSYDWEKVRNALAAARKAGII